jgi:putative hydrolase of the HAD superfamily
MRTINRLAGITTIVFDWGNTLMKELPYDGPMVNWPVVEAIPGSSQAIQSLKSRYRLVLASNAVNSNAPQIESALARVDLDGIMDSIFTFNELGSRKPQPAFFAGICEHLGTDPSQMLMVGDIWKVDISGALQADWNAAWYNPSCSACPGLLPSHQIELHNLADLPDRLIDLNLPDPPEALRWLQEQGASQTILIHVQLVASLAYQLAEWLSSCGETVNPILAHRGGLLHDLAKLSANRPDAPTHHHGDLAGLLLEEVDQPALAGIARRHVISLPEVQSQYQPRTWEEKLVYYADKLIESTRLVSLAERMAALNQRYPGEINRFVAGLPAVLAVEKMICNILGGSPSDLFRLLQRALFEGQPVVIGRSD